MIRNLAVHSLIILSFGMLAVADAGMTLIVDDFDNGVLTNTVGQETGVWSCNFDDTEQFCEAELVNDVKVGDEGFSLKLNYDITVSQDYIEGFPNTAYNGYWSKFDGLDVSDYKYLTLYVKGGKDAGYTTKFCIELKDPDNVARVQVSGITEKWRKIKIPLSKFSNIRDWTNLIEFAVVFDQVVTAKEGVIYIDNIAFE